MLTVNVDELEAQLLQNRHGHQGAVYPADVFSVHEDVPLDHGLFIIVYTILPKPGKGRDLGKHRPDGGFVGSGPDHIPVGPFAQNGGDGIDDNGFARTGFAGEHVKARVKRDVRLLNDRNILNVQ